MDSSTLILRKIQNWIDEASIHNDTENHPKDELKESDRVIGTLPDDLKKLYIVLSRWDKIRKETYIRLKGDVDQAGGPEISAERKNEIDKEYARVCLKHDLIYSVFSTCLQLEFLKNLTGVEATAVRKDWQLVVVDPEIVAKEVLAGFVKDVQAYLDR